MTDTATRPSADRVEEINVPARTVVGMREHVTVADLPEFFARAVSATADELARMGMAPSGPPMVVYRHEADRAFDVTVGFPVEQLPATSDALTVEELPAGRAACAEHVGPYETLPAAYTTMSSWLGERKVPVPEVIWEEYVVGPTDADEASCRTRIVCPVC